MSYAVAYWCVLIIAVLPYVWTSVAKSAAGKRYDNRNPRTWQAQQDNPRSQWAHAAQLNGFEAFPLIAAGVLMAQVAGVSASVAATLALVILAARIAHGLAYIAGLASLRSLVWFIGFGCTVALMVLAALHVA
ncbi:MAPEG family protein [Pseudoxanthomonas sp.]|uniref:MAPEG family protein n=1 Tax=Pseudoxanthomonas sp. TaxID=1871049 RepID=UPI002637B348|nr:MAPEG family protein [Pseudoxanthomonas sp.]WDS34819.1 MAG: MAPEG family protein [Pseudoxanthomonas sp.]